MYAFTILSEILKYTVKMLIIDHTLIFFLNHRYIFFKTIYVTRLEGLIPRLKIQE